jgi:hypothetical protein
MFLVIALISGGFAFGLIVGRWWALAAPIAFAVWVYKTDSPTFLGGTDISRGGVATVVGVWGSLAVLGGIGVRRITGRFVTPSE